MFSLPVCLQLPLPALVKRSLSEKRLFVYVIDRPTRENDCNLSILAAAEPPLPWLGADWRFGVLAAARLAACRFSRVPCPPAKGEGLEGEQSSWNH